MSDARPVAADPPSSRRVEPPIALSEVEIGGAWNVQGDPDRSAFVDAVAQRFGVALPRLPATLSAGSAVTAYWLGPASWLLVGASPLAPDAFVARRDAINAAGGALFDVSASRRAFT